MLKLCLNQMLYKIYLKTEHLKIKTITYQLHRQPPLKAALVQHLLWYPIPFSLQLHHARFPST